MKKLFDTYRQMWTVVDQDEAGFWPLAGLVVLLAASIGVFVVVMYSFIVLSHLGWPVLGVFAALAVGFCLKYVVSRGRAIRNGHI